MVRARGQRRGRRAVAERDGHGREAARDAAPEAELAERALAEGEEDAVADGQRVLAARGDGCDAAAEADALEALEVHAVAEAALAAVVVARRVGRAARGPGQVVAVARRDLDDGLVEEATGEARRRHGGPPRVHT